MSDEWFKDKRDIKAAFSAAEERYAHLPKQERQARLRRFVKEFLKMYKFLKMILVSFDNEVWYGGKEGGAYGSIINFFRNYVEPKYQIFKELHDTELGAEVLGGLSGGLLAIVEFGILGKQANKNMTSGQAKGILAAFQDTIRRFKINTPGSHQFILKRLNIIQAKHASSISKTQKWLLFEIAKAFA